MGTAETHRHIRRNGEGKASRLLILGVVSEYRAKMFHSNKTTMIQPTTYDRKGSTRSKNSEYETRSDSSVGGVEKKRDGIQNILRWHNRQKQGLPVCVKLDVQGE